MKNLIIALFALSLAGSSAFATNASDSKSTNPASSSADQVVPVTDPYDPNAVPTASSSDQDQSK